MAEIDNVFSLMKERNVTPKEISEKTGISTGNISDWKSGRCAPKTEALIKIADYFGVSLDYLLGRTEEKNANKKGDASSDDLSEYLEELRTRPEMKMLFNITKKATRAEVEKAVKVIEAMLQDE